MAMIPVFHGHVSDAARLVLLESEQPLRHAYLKSLVGKAVDVIVRKQRVQRSIEMNAYLHAEPFPKLAEFFGCTIPEVKLALMGECFGWQRDKLSGREIPIKPSTSDMSVEESTYFVDWVIPWAAQNHGVIILHPKEGALL